MEKKLNGKVALITGGSSGIGLATAKLFVREGAHVFITGRREDELDQAVEDIGDNVVGIRGDVTKSAELDRLYSQIAKQKGHLDIVFANAGSGTLVPLGAITEEHYTGIFDINVKGVIFTVQKALSLLKDGGSIILSASTAGSTGNAGFGLYGASKAAVRSFARSWTTELASRKIRVNAISAGVILTAGYRAGGMTEEQVKQFSEHMATQIPLGRVGLPAEVAKAALFLASDDSSFVAGIELFVDGGMTQV